MAFINNSIMKTLFQNIQIVNHDSISEAQDLLIEDGKIKRIGANLSLDSGRGQNDIKGGQDDFEVIDCGGKYLLPGIIDSHVHFRTPGHEYKEDWETGSRAALMGGVTTVLDMPNNMPPIFTVEALEAKRKLVAEKAMVNFGLYFGTNGANLEEILKVKNIPAVKVYMNLTTGNLKITDPEVLQAIFSVPQRYALHAEGVTFDLALKYLLPTKNEVYLCHASLKREVERVRSLKNQGDKRVFMEVCPHHLFMTAEDRVRHGAYCCMKPELATEEDRQALWQGISDGTIDTVATDHAPHTKEDKDQASPAFGVPGVEFSLALMLNEVSQANLQINDVVRLMSYNPAKIFGIQGKGEIKEGMDADLVLLDMEMKKKIQNEEVVSKCGWTPYDGKVTQGWPIMTIRNGEIMMRDRKIISSSLGAEVLFA